jgi:superfamily II DNA or RNA helicase
VSLRPFQSATLDKIQTLWKKGVNTQLVKWPTGCGKTVLASALPARLNTGKKMLMLVHREELASQSVDKIQKWNPGLRVGLEMGDSFASPYDDVVVAGVATIGRKDSKRLARFNPDEFSTIVTDECQHATSQTYLNVLNYFNVFNDPTKLLVGLTATPNRADGEGLGKVFKEIVYDYSLLQAIKDGWLCDLKGVRIRTDTSLDNVHTKGGDFDQAELGDTVNTPKRNDLVVRSWLEHGKDRQTVWFCVNVQHAKDLADTFKRYGVAAEAIWGDDPDRRAKLKYHREGTLKVITNCQILIEGYDDWRIGCIGLAAPTKSAGRYTQVVGRGTRIPDYLDNLVEARKRGDKLEKEDCIIIDVVDVASKHNLQALPTLFGLGKMDMRGKSVLRVMKELDDLKAAKPLVDPTAITDADQIKGYAEQIDLFKVTFPPEIEALSAYQWRRVGEEQYALLLPNKESLHIGCDMLGRWSVLGVLVGYPLKGVFKSLEEAVKVSDAYIKKLGGSAVETLVRRVSKWHIAEPTEGQLKYCKILKIVVPPGATKGEVHLKINEVLANKAKFTTERVKNVA